MNHGSQRKSSDPHLGGCKSVMQSPTLNHTSKQYLAKKMGAGVRKKHGGGYSRKEGWQNSRGYKEQDVGGEHQTGVSGTQQDGVFPVAAVTHRHKCRGLKPHRRVLLTALEVRSPHSVSQGQCLDVGRADPSRKLQEKTRFFVFFIFCCWSAFLGLWLHLHPPQSE